MLDQKTSVKLQKKLSLKNKLSLERKLTVMKKDNSVEEMKLEEKWKFVKIIGENKTFRDTKPLMEGHRSLERSCGARHGRERSQGLGLGISPVGKIGTPEKQKRKKKLGKKVGAIKKLFEHVEVPSPLPLRGQKTILLHFHVTNFAVQVAKPSLKFVTNRKNENEQEEAWESKDPPGLAAQNCAEEGSDQPGQSRQSGLDRQLRQQIDQPVAEPLLPE